MAEIGTLAGKARMGMLGLGVCYFLWYTPYSAVAKAMSGGLIGVTNGPVGGLVLLPAAALGTLLAMPIGLSILGWWKYSRRRQILGLSVPFPGRETASSAFWMAWIVGTTTLNFTFIGGPILLMLVLMRIETLVVSPTVDLVRQRRIHPHSWVAVGLSLASALVALSDVNNYQLSTLAVISLLAYMVGYLSRFLIMSRHAKVGRLELDRRYLVEEHMCTPVFLVLMLGVLALFGPAVVAGPLQVGFTSFLVSPAAWPAFVIGMFYEGLFICTTLIFLDRREYSFCMPVHVCSSLLAGVAASLALTAIYGIAPPSTATFLAAICVTFAALALSYPAIKHRLAAPRPAHLLFVCGGNTIRSPMAAALARAQLDAMAGGGAFRVASAGVAVQEPGKPFSSRAAEVLTELKVPVPRRHTSRLLTPKLCEKSAAVYCMTRAHRDAVLDMAPNAQSRVMCLDPQEDVPEPHGESTQAYMECAHRIQQLVRARLLEQFRSRLAASQLGS